jgi:hypothetical protein
MKTLSETEGRKEFSYLWESHQKEWFKLEVRQDYTGEDDNPSLQAWHAGNHQDSLDMMRSHIAYRSFFKDCQRKVARGILLHRVRIIEEPLTPYTQWELSMMKYAEKQMNQKLRWVGSAAMEGLAIPAGDMNIFDDHHVLIADYTEQGRMRHADLYDSDHDDISRFLTLKNEALARSMPLREYHSPDLPVLE